MGKVIELSYLNKISNGKVSFVIEMIDIFLDQNTEDMKIIEDAIAKSNFGVIKAIAHKMKSSIQFIGLSDKIEDNLDAMENVPLESRNIEFIKKQFEKVKIVCKKATEELIEYKKTL